MPPATLVPPMSMPMASGPSATGCLLRVVGVTHRDGSAGRRGGAPRPGRAGSRCRHGGRVRRSGSVASGVGGCRWAAGRAAAREVGEHRGGQAGEVGEPGQRLGAERAHHGRTPAQRAPGAERVVRSRHPVGSGTGTRRRAAGPRRRGSRHPASRATRRRRPRPGRRPRAGGPAASAADRRRLSRSRLASSATDPTCSSQRSAPTGPQLLVTLEPHPQLTAAHGSIAGRCTAAAPTAG